MKRKILSVFFCLSFVFTLLVFVKPTKVYAEAVVELFNISDALVTENNELVLKVDLFSGGSGHTTYHFTSIVLTNSKGENETTYTLTEVTSSYVNPIYSQFEYYKVNNLSVNPETNFSFYVKEITNSSQTYEMNNFSIVRIVGSHLVTVNCYYSIENELAGDFFGLGGTWNSVVHFALSSVESGNISLNQLRNLRLMYSNDMKDFGVMTLDIPAEKTWLPDRNGNEQAYYIANVNDIATFKSKLSGDSNNILFFYAADGASGINTANLNDYPSGFGSICSKAQFSAIDYADMNDVSVLDLPEDIDFGYCMYFNNVKLYDNKSGSNGDGFAAVQCDYVVNDSQVLFGSTTGYYITLDPISGEEVVLDKDLQETDDAYVDENGVLRDSESGKPLLGNNFGNAKTEDPGLLKKLFGGINNLFGGFGKIISIVITIIFLVLIIKFVGLIVNLFKKK